MTCERIDLGGGATVITCGPRRRAKPCTVPGCRAPATILCDFPLKGAKAGTTCSKALCRGHAVNQADVVPFSRTIEVQLTRDGSPIEVTLPADPDETFDLCPAHDKLVVRKEGA